MFYFIDIGLIVFSLMHICTYVIHLCRYLESKFLSHSVLFILQCSFQDVTTATISCIHLNILHAAAKSLQSCSTLCDPIDGSPPGPPSLGFSRQDHWSGLPFPSPMHEREKWKWSRSVVSNSSRPHGLQPTRPLHPWDFPGKSTGVGCHCLLRNKCIHITEFTLLYIRN